MKKEVFIIKWTHKKTKNKGIVLQPNNLIRAYLHKEDANRQIEIDEANAFGNFDKFDHEVIKATLIIP